MTTRELWQNIMHYGEFDRMPVIHWGGWEETRRRWLSEGLPENVSEHEYFGAQPMSAGVNVMFPVEIGPWKADPYAFRKKYGKELRIFGGIDKLEIAKGPEAIDAEIARRLPLMKEGGFIPLPDHLITPETSLEDYKYYLEQIRKLRF